MKKPHKSKAKPRRETHTRAPNLVAHSTRRQAPPQAHPRRQTLRLEPAVLYRRPHPLTIQSADDGRLLRLLLLPFALMALVMAIVPSLHVFPTLRELIARTPQIAATEVQPGPVAAVTPALALAPVAAGPSLAPAQPEALALATPDRAAAAPAALRSALVMPVGGSPPPASPVATAHPVAAVPGNVSTNVPMAVVEPPPLRGAVALYVAPRVVANSGPPLRSPDPAVFALGPLLGETAVAMLIPPPRDRELTPVPAKPLGTTCPVEYGSAQAAGEPPDARLPFGRQLAQAAAAQTQRFVIYDDRYRQIAASRGDVPALFGVCTDVVVRAYRTLGVDLQGLVQESRLGAGDPNIDHRRTETLRRYLARYGATFVPSRYGEDYQPGDIVTYWRPQNSGSRSHIAVVADTLGPSGNPMIIHNRGWGPQMEDALFVDRMTGHYRYDASIRPAQSLLATTPSRPVPGRPAATPITLRKSESVTVTAPGKAAGL